MERWVKLSIEEFTENMETRTESLGPTYLPEPNEEFYVSGVIHTPCSALLYLLGLNKGRIYAIYQKTKKRRIKKKLFKRLLAGSVRDGKTH